MTLWSGAALFGAALLAIGLAGCPVHHGNPPGGTPGTITVGLTSEEMGGVVGAIHVTTTVDGQPVTDDAIVTLNNPFAYPKEIKLTAPASNPSAIAQVHVDAFADPAWPTSRSGTPLLTRTAEATFVPAQDLLMRVRLERGCVTGAPGSTGPTCTGSRLTCVANVCKDDTVPVEPYTPGWATQTSDICKPPNAGPPAVIVGSGQTDYLPLTDGQTVQAELGPQGGHHIWIAVRMHNLKQSGSTTTITATQPGTGVNVVPTSFVFTFDQDEGGYCKLAGLRFQLDAGGADYHQFLGKPLDVTVVVADASGAKGTGVVHININPQILCPNGTVPCN